MMGTFVVKELKVVYLKYNETISNSYNCFKLITSN